MKFLSNAPRGYHCNKRSAMPKREAIGGKLSVFWFMQRAFSLKIALRVMRPN